ncbi:serine hydrolase domain-containing protein [Kitasatospora sp. NPDC059803]|uniref:serine hydrolase domain-containing protein n=1 Tax=Kitasatospora sp. NPDC059803 TaxID=3346953 RepID=UPI003646867A
MDENVVRGTVAEGFETVREEFAAVATGEGGDHAAQLVAYRHGERVVDLWTGPESTADSLFGAYSASKGATHLVVASLVQEGVLDLERKVGHYWPQFAVEGKGDVTLRELLAHRAGLVGADAGFTIEELADDRIVAERLGAQRPYWRPGTAFGYHALVVGALSGEVVRRATGRSVQELFAERVRPRSAGRPRRAAWPGCTRSRSDRSTARPRCSSRRRSRWPGRSSPSATTWSSACRRPSPSVSTPPPSTTRSSARARSATTARAVNRPSPTRATASPTATPADAPPSPPSPARRTTA